nr:response regulator [Butyrivibrio sp.]
DTSMNLTVIKSLLKPTEVLLDTAMSGHEMLEMVTKQIYDIIFIDYRMPEMDGIEALKNLKALNTNLSPSAPCIVLTANVISGAKQHFVSEGFDDYLSKPIDSEELEEMLYKYLPKDKLITESQNTSDDLVLTEKEMEILNSIGIDDKKDDNTNMEVISDFLKGLEVMNFEPSSPDSNTNTDSNEFSSNEDASAKYKEIINRLEGVDTKTGILHCMDEETYVEILKDYYDHITEKADKIESYMNEGDFKNYTVLVHALKSSSRTIGALELGDKAEYLEKCGDDQNISEINARTPELLELYRSYLKKLSPVAPEDASNDSREEIPLSNLHDAYMTIKELISVFDFDSAEAVMEMLEEYSIPESEKDKYDKVVSLMRNFDQAGLLEILN